MRKFKQLTLKERYQIESMLQQKMRPAAIARKLKRHRSTIYREIDKGRSVFHTPEQIATGDAINDKIGFKPQFYDSENSHVTTIDRKHWSRLKACKYLQKGWEEIVVPKLKKGWSPEKISGRLKLENHIYGISYSTIYRGIHALKFGFLGSSRDDFYLGLLKKYRRRYRKVKRYYGKVSIRKLRIEDRPLEANLRLKRGHWERDIFYGKKDKTGIIAFVDRRSRLVKIRKLERVTKELVNLKTNELILNERVITLTNDNGPEFNDHGEIKRDHNIDTYFASPYCPWERGSVENAIKRLRKFIPKKKALDCLDDESIMQIEEKFNLIPLKILNYRTPFEIHREKQIKLVA